MKAIVLKLLPFLALLACGTPSQKSEQKWAQFKTEYTYGSIPARLLYLKNNYATNFTKLRVCVQESTNYAGSNLLLEVKMAYAAWLEASGEGSEETWNRMEFVLQDKCDFKDASFGSAVAIASSEHQDAAQYSSAFNQVLCTPSSSSFRYPAYDCNSWGQTLGLGGPGGASFRGRTARSSFPSTATLTPYVEWASLEKDLDEQLRFANADRNTANTMRAQGFSAKSGVTKETLQALVDGYRALKEQAETLPFEAIKAFNQKLTEARYENSNNLNYVPSPFAASKYMPEKTAYHTLLHEVGHQFGMAHAHAPSSGDVTGPSPLAQEKNGLWICNDATMAYNNNYTFLSDDDRLGLADLQFKLSELIK